VLIYCVNQVLSKYRDLECQRKKHKLECQRRLLDYIERYLKRLIEIEAKQEANVVEANHEVEEADAELRHYACVLCSDTATINRLADELARRKVKVDQRQKTFKLWSERSSSFRASVQYDACCKATGRSSLYSEKYPSTVRDKVKQDIIAYLKQKQERIKAQLCLMSSAVSSFFQPK